MKKNTAIPSQAEQAELAARVERMCNDVSIAALDALMGSISASPATGEGRYAGSARESRRVAEHALNAARGLIEIIPQ